MILSRFKSNWKIKIHFDWLDRYLNNPNGFSYPICLEIDPSNTCPLNCRLCFWKKYRNEVGEKIPKEKLLSLVKQAANLGVKAIIWTGGGEPLSNPATTDAIKLANELGLNNGLFTNGVLLDKKKAGILADSLNWIRFNMAGSDRKSYSLAHQVPPDVFDSVCNNIKVFVKTGGKKVDTGIGTAINPRNFEGIKKFPYLAMELGVEYFQGKLDFQLIGTDEYIKWWESTVIPYFDKVEEELKGKIKIHIFRDPIVRKTEVLYCHAHRVITAITADGRVAFCKMRRDQKDTTLGSIYENDLREIFEGEKQREIAGKIHPKTCQILNVFCPYRTTNEAIEELKEICESTPETHRDFF